jgi:cytochrome c5
VAGAPKLGDKEAWAPRIAAGMDAMLANAIKGKNAMPPKGTCTECSEKDLAAAIEYLVSKSR